MAKPEQVNAGFRLPSELVEWLDQYATFLSDESGYNVSRTQALLRVISLAKPKEEKRMSEFYNLKKLKEDGYFLDIREAKRFLTGAEIIFREIQAQNRSEGIKSVTFDEFIQLAIFDESIKKRAIDYFDNQEATIRKEITKLEFELQDERVNGTGGNKLGALEMNLMLKREHLRLLKSRQ